MFDWIFKIYSENCFKGSGRKLNYFKTYTKSNCMIEYLSDYINKICGCHTHTLPRLNNAKLCNATMEKCAENARNDLQAKMMKNIIRNKGTKDECRCLPLCTRISYEAEMTFDDLRFFVRNRRVRP